MEIEIISWVEVKRCILYLFVGLGGDGYRNEFQSNPQSVYYLVLIPAATSNYKRK